MRQGEGAQCRDGGGGGVHRIGDTVRGPAVPSGPAICHPEPAGAQGAVYDALIARAVERDRRGDLSRGTGEERLGAAQVAHAFLAGRGDEIDGCLQAHAHTVDLLGERQHRGEAPAVVADARTG